jgi:antitoxin component YwqK of YwqJK toxin-antitoxin module
MQLPVGLQVLYFENGQVEDSSFYEDHHIKYSFHYYPNNQLESHYYLPDNKKEGIAEGYDESGKRIKKYVFEKEPEFKGGEKAWVAYIKKTYQRI